MEWFTAAGDVYHRTCTSESKWTPSDVANDGMCLGCGSKIPDDVLATARDRMQPTDAAPPSSSDPSIQT